MVALKEKTWVAGGQKCEGGPLFSNTFVPFEFCSLGMYQLFNTKIFYLKVQHALIIELATFDHALELLNSKSFHCS